MIYVTENVQKERLLENRCPRVKLNELQCNVQTNLLSYVWPCRLYNYYGLTVYWSILYSTKFGEFGKTTVTHQYRTQPNSRFAKVAKCQTFKVM